MTLAAVLCCVLTVSAQDAQEGRNRTYSITLGEVQYTHHDEKMSAGDAVGQVLTGVLTGKTSVQATKYEGDVKSTIIKGLSSAYRFRFNNGLIRLDDIVEEGNLVVDALITNVPGVCIGVSTADCIPIIIYDPEHHAAGVVHSGWRGTVANIAYATVAAMTMAYHSQPESLLAVIGPGISRKNFEVGDDVYEPFAAAGYPMDAIAERMDKWHIDLPNCCRLQLESTGIPSANIRLTDICTYDQTDDFFSARKLGTLSGRILTGIVLR